METTLKGVIKERVGNKKLIKLMVLCHITNADCCLITEKLGRVQKIVSIQGLNFRIQTLKIETNKLKILVILSGPN